MSELTNMSGELNNDEFVIVVEVENSSSKRMRLWIEPWTFEYWLLPQESAVLVAKGPKAGFPKLIYEDDTIIYHAWAQSVFAIYKNGELLGPSLEECLREPFPISESHAAELKKYIGG